jgi:MgtC family
LYGGAIGFNRDIHGKPTGIRAHALVSLGAALLLVAGGRTIRVGDHPDGLSRVIQGIAAGLKIDRWLYGKAGIKDDDRAWLRRRRGRTVRVTGLRRNIFRLRHAGHGHLRRKWLRLAGHRWRTRHRIAGWDEIGLGHGKSPLYGKGMPAGERRAFPQCDG